MGIVSFGEPFTNLLTQGMVCKETVRCPQHGWLLPEELAEDNKCAKCGKDVEFGRTEKMSKSKKNVVDPEALIAGYCADTARLFSLFAAPPEKDLEWSEQGVEGSYRFLRRVWKLAADNQEWLMTTAPFKGGELKGAAKDIRRKAHETIVRVTGNIEDRFHFNTAISASMELVNDLSSFTPEDDTDRAVFREAVDILVTLLSPMVPHFAEELWEALGNGTRLFDTPWPDADAAALVKEAITIVVQVNGKVRGRLEVSPEAEEAEVDAAARADENVVRHLEDKTVVKVVYVKGRLLNIVVK